MHSYKITGVIKIPYELKYSIIIEEILINKHNLQSHKKFGKWRALTVI